MHALSILVRGLRRTLREGRCAAGQALWRTWVRLLGAEVSSSARFSGMPYIQVRRGSRLLIGPGVVIHSDISANPVIGRRTTTISTCSGTARIELGRGVGLSGVCICAAIEITIGEGTIVGADAMILDTDFHLPLSDWKWSNAAADTALPVRIGRGCFIGTRAIVLKGVTIGDGAVVGAGAVVTHDVPAGYLASGNPAVLRPLPEKWKR